MYRISTEVVREHYQRNGNRHFQNMELSMYPCPICEALGGKIFPVSDMKVGLNAPPMYPNCHCSTGPAYTEEEEKLYNDWLDSGVAREGMVLEEYEKTYTRCSVYSTNTGSRNVEYNPDADFYMDIPGLSSEIKQILSRKVREIVKLGSENCYEYASMIDLDTGAIREEYTDHEPGNVRPDYAFF